jgi:hypothetical protein
VELPRPPVRGDDRATISAERGGSSRSGKLHRTLGHLFGRGLFQEPEAIWHRSGLNNGTHKVKLAVVWPNTSST